MIFMDTKTDPNIHTSVLLRELVWAISLKRTEKNIVVDATLGLAGHAGEILKHMHAWDILIGFDADERNLSLAKTHLEKIQTQFAPWVEIILIHSNFVDLRERLQDYEITSVSAIYYDLGVSSLHFDEAERGFSLRLEWPLDMRFDTRSWKTAADILNYAEEKEIFQILKDFWEEPAARKIAARVLEARKQKKFQTTTDLIDFLDSEINKHIKTKMRVFQALRIAVNHELENLEKSLWEAIEILEPNGIIFAISFHSLEDRIVKQTFKKESKDCICRDIICTCKHTKKLKILTKKPILPSEIEQKNNPRSRSAKARAATKI